MVGWMGICMKFLDVKADSAFKILLGGRVLIASKVLAGCFIANLSTHVV